MKRFVQVGETRINVEHIVTISVRPNRSCVVRLDNGETVEGQLIDADWIGGRIHDRH